MELLAAEAADEVLAFFDSQDLSASADFERLESTVRGSVLNLGARWLALLLNRDRSDCRGARLPCSCGAMARYAGRREKTFTSALGELVLSRVYYHCEPCAGGFFPKDQALGLVRRSVTPGVLRMIGQLAARVSFAEAAALLWELARLNVSDKQAERCAEALGEEVADDERRHVEVRANAAATLYLGMDGTGVPMRASETLNRQGRESEDARAKTRECKEIVIWSAETLNDEGRPVRDPGSVTYNAAIESAAVPPGGRQISVFAERVEREARRREFYQAGRQVVVGDGASWIWNTCSELFPDAIEILDIYHAKERIWGVGKEVYGIGTDFTGEWVEARLDELRAGDVDALLAALSAHAEQNTLAAEAVVYFTNHRKRVRYAEFRAQGLCVSSGVVEAGCKTAIGARLKRSGMHWTVRGANAIAALRCCVLSGRFDEFWNRRKAA